MLGDWKFCKGFDAVQVQWLVSQHKCQLPPNSARLED